MSKDLVDHWLSLPPPPDDKIIKRELVLKIHGHIDGVKWFENSIQPKGVPILATLVGIEDLISKKSVKIANLDPFVVGVMQQSSPTDTKEFVRDFVYELRRLGVRDPGERSFTVCIMCILYCVRQICISL
jgi:hypothetical protein